MPKQGSPIFRIMRQAAVALAVLAMLCPIATAQDDGTGTGTGTDGNVSYSRSAVGGVSVNAEGVLSNATVDQTGRLAKLLAESRKPVPSDLNQLTPLRHISLRKLEAAVQEYVKSGKPLDDEMHYLAGLQEIRYVFVYPEQNDIVLVGPGEGWKVDAKGNVIGVSSGRPVLLLDDLLVALRTARAAQQQAISCSIDPRPEGLTQLRSYVKTLRAGMDPRVAMANIEQALGPQVISVTGVPETSHFARVMVAADYRMKRLAMNFEPSPVPGLPSYLSMMKGGGRGMPNMLPRWWLEPRYESVTQSPDGLAWEFDGASVKAMTEEDFLTANGDREHTGKASPLAQRWADGMTANYEALALADPIFGQLRNCMEMAIVSALVVREDLTAKAGYSMPTLLDPTDVEIAKFPVPKQVDTQASVLKKGSTWLISASGGVQINSYAAIKDVKQSETLAPLRAKAAAPADGAWWWN
jgi:hypothetical protein